ncbi:ragulator complex protein LAMTOR1-like [Watersipora subatra]|uniref:ragulator complex protein LAMTOR1-like n=1 Tax=Watersipora subatra TaxID=2589382 RepID=UPI00355C4456
MGCCESAEPKSLDEPTNETEPLLGGGRSSLESSGHGQAIGDSSGYQQRSDEQSALSRILQETSNNLIDISAQSLADVTEETEAQFKVKQYSSRINTVRVPLHSKLGLGSGRSKALNILAEPLIPLSDLDLVTQAAQRTPQCMSQVCVHHKEDLIVHFGAP